MYSASSDAIIAHAIINYGNVSNPRANVYNIYDETFIGGILETGHIHVHVSHFSRCTPSKTLYAVFQYCSSQIFGNLN